MSDSKTLTVGHSPDPDDAFMFHALFAGKVDTRGWGFREILEDIQSLNDRATRGELDITAISIHAYPYVADRYALTNCGSSMGDGYGPIVVSRSPMGVEDLRGKFIAIPGERTTAFLALNLLLGRAAFRHKVVMFDQIARSVVEGEVDAGLLIHEGQLTYHRDALHAVVDLGEHWKRTTGLPLPLGGNAIRRDLGPEAMCEIERIIRASIEYGLEHRSDAMKHAMRFGRDLDLPLTDRFVGMYVNHWTVDYGHAGREAVRELLSRAAQAGLVPAMEEVDFVGA
ncbi:MAG: MqnA/MqnD/SBP family protein [Planctomycetota bacterium]